MVIVVDSISFQLPITKLPISGAQERAELADEVGELVADGVAELADADGLEHAGVAELLEHHAHLVGHGPLAVVGLDAADEPGLAPRK